MLDAVERDMFSPATYAGVRRALADAETLPPFCYSSDAFFRREVERIFMKAWNFIGRADRIPNPGDYFTLEFVGVPIVLLPGEDAPVGGVVRLAPPPAPLPPAAPLR